MKKVFIYACELLYQGLHGMETYWVDELSDNITEEDINNELVKEASFSVMESYPDIMDDLYEQARDEADEEKLEEYVSELMEQNVSGYCAFIRDDVTLSIRELDEIANEIGPDNFVKQYCV